MSIARRVTVRRLLGTGAAALVLSVAGASSAWATGPGGHGWGHGGFYKPGTGAGQPGGADKCQFSLDGKKFFDSVKVDDQNLRPTEDGKVHIKVRTAPGASVCTASLASYLAHGPTFETSGEQVFVDFDTVTVKPGRVDSLDIAVPDAGCFAQIDLYRGNTKFDGDLDAKDGLPHGPLPKGPDRPVIKDKLIAAWNGGTKDCTRTQTPPASEPPASEPPASEPPASEPPASEPPASEPPASEPPASETPATSESPEPSAAESSPAPAPSTNGDGGDLANTGGSSATLPIAIGAVVLLAGGAGMVVLTRRRKAAAGE